MKALVVGYGNPLRSDDGVGLSVARDIDALNLPGVEARSLHQLGPELIDDFSQFDLVFLIDAAQDGPPVRIRRPDEAPPGERPSTHHFGPESMLRLARSLGKRAPEMLLCTIRGENFAIGDSLSDVVGLRAEEAKNEIIRTLNRK